MVTKITEHGLFSQTNGSTRSGLIPGTSYAGAVNTNMQTKNQSVIHATNPTPPSPSHQTPQTAQVVR
ncbi:hypothetical protein [Absidia glauca]|uniref:Uncharacterized protein n=1 Tax=Absidia glauca TaxID=4829 RepID=A0A163JD05_ABSGL|nr:hypothetical protein [Absidia glauca]